MNEKILRKLYNNAQRYYNLPSFEQFVQDMQDVEKLESFRQNMSKYYNIPDLETLKSDIGFGEPVVQKKSQDEPTSVGEEEPMVSPTEPTQEEPITSDSLSVDTTMVEPQQPQPISTTDAEMQPTQTLVDAEEKIVNLRNKARLNPDGSESTVLMESAEVDGRFIAYPTLFPKNPDYYTEQPDTWMELGSDDAYREALNRDEVFYFDTEEEAQSFAEGSWKKKDFENQYFKQVDEMLKKSNDPFYGTFLQEDFDHEKEFGRRLESVTPELINREESFVVPDMIYRFGDYGFKFEETGAGDAMRVKALNDESIIINLDPFTLRKEKKNAEKLRKFLIENRASNEQLQRAATLTNQIAKKERLVKDEQEYKNTVKLFQKQEEDFKKFAIEVAIAKNQLEQKEKAFNALSPEQKESPAAQELLFDIQEQRKKITQDNLEVLKKFDSLSVKGKKLDEITAKYTAMKAEQGSVFFSGAGTNAILSGIENIEEGLVGRAIDLIAMGTEQQVGLSTGLNPNDISDLMNQYAKKEIEGNFSKYDFSGVEGLGESPSKEEVASFLNGLMGKSYEEAKAELNKITIKGTGTKGMTSIREGFTTGTPDRRLGDESDLYVRDGIKKYLKYYSNEYGDMREYSKTGIKPAKQAIEKYINEGTMRKDPSMFAGAATGLTEGGIIDMIDGAIVKAVGSKDSTEQFSDMAKQDFWAGAYLGMLESAPSMALTLVNPMAGTAALFAQTTAMVDEEMRNNPEFDNISEREKFAVQAPIGLAVATLERIGLRNIINQKGVLNGLVAKALGKATSSTTGKGFQEIIRQEVDNAMARGLLTIGAGGLAEFETGFLQELATIGIEEIYDLSKEKNMFENPNTFWGVMGESLYAGLQEGVGGGMMAGFGAVVNATWKGQMATIDNETYELFEAMIKDDTYKDIYLAKLDEQEINGEITAEEKKKQVDAVNQIAGIIEGIPKDMSTENKKKSLELAYEKQILLNETGGKIKELSERKQDRIKRIDQRLRQIDFISTEESQINREAEAAIPSVANMNEVEENFDPQAEPEPTPSKEQEGDLDDEAKQRRDIREMFLGEGGAIGAAKNIFFNKKGKRQLPEDDNTKRLRAKVITYATKAANSIQQVLPDTKIVLFETTQEMRKNFPESDGSSGYYDTASKTVAINLEKATQTTVGHEVFHAIVVGKLGTESKISQAVLKMAESVRKAEPSNRKLRNEVDKFIKAYEGDPEPLIKEERLSELFGLLSSNYASFKKPTKNKVVNFIKEVLEGTKLGKLIGSAFYDNDAKVIGFLTAVAEKVKEGDVILEEDIQIIDVLTADGDVGVQATSGRKQINADEVRSRYRSGSRISKGLIQRTVNKKPVYEEIESLSRDYVKKKAPKLYIKNAALLAQEQLVKGVQDIKNIDSVKKADRVYDIFEKQVADNLIFLTEQYEEYKDISSLWYDGANVIAQNLAKKYDVTTEQVAGMIASMSPQKDWYQNVRLAELTLMAYQENPVMTQEMVDFQREISSRSLKKKTGEELTKANNKIEELQSKLQPFVGTKLKDIPVDFQSYPVRLWSEVNNLKDYDILRPDGEVMGKAVSKITGKPKRVAWGSYTEIGKAVSIYNDGSASNITRTLGLMHKIRNFYNNIIDPMSKDGDVTIDTHAVGAALLKPLSSSSKIVNQAFGGAGASSSNEFGIKGTYFAYADAYNLAAQRLGLLPRQVQSITWEAVRGLFPDSYKAQKKNIEAINKIWNRFENKEITYEEARNEVLEEAGGINRPSWAREVKREPDTERIDEPVSGERGRGRKVSDDVFRDDRRGRKQIVGEQATVEARKKLNLAKALAEGKKLTLTKKLMIKLATGWELGADGLWRHELPPIQLKENFKIENLRQTIGGFYNATLKDIIDYTELFKAYPTEFVRRIPTTDEDGFSYDLIKTFTPIKDLRVYFDAASDDIYYDEAQRIINIGFRNINTYQDIRKALAHELQHWIQDREGFQIGSNENDPLYFKTMGEVEARNVERRMLLFAEERKKYLLEMTEDEPRYNQVLEPKTRKDFKKIDEFLAEEINVSEIDKLLKFFSIEGNGEKIEKAYGTKRINLIKKSLEKIKKEQEAAGLTKIEVGDLVNEIITGGGLNQKVSVTNLLATAEFEGFTDMGIFPVPAVKGRQQKSLSDMIIEGRDADIRDSIIEEFLVFDLGFPSKVVREMMTINADLFKVLPRSFRNVKGGAKSGAALYSRVKDYEKKLVAGNKRRKVKLTEQQIADKVIEFLEQQPEYKAEAETYTVGSKKKGTKETLTRKYLSTQQAAMLYEFQKSVGTRPTEFMADKIREARAIFRERTRGAKELQRVKSQVRNFIRKSLPKGVFTSKFVVDLVRELDRATYKTVEINGIKTTEIQDVIRRIERMIIERNIKILEQDIESLLNKNYTTTVSGRRKGKIVSAYVKDRVDNIKSLLVDKKSKTLEEDIEKANKEIQKRLDELQKVVMPNKENLDLQADLQIALNYNDSLLLDDDVYKVEQLDLVKSNLKELIDFGRSELQAELAEASAKYTALAEMAYEEITGTQVKLGSKEERAKVDLANEKMLAKKRNQLNNNLKRLYNKISIGIKSFINSHEALDGIMGLLQKLPAEMFGGRLQEAVTFRADASTRKYKQGMLEMGDMLEAELERLYGKKWKAQVRKNNNIGKFGKHEPTIIIDKKAVDEATKDYNNGDITQSEYRDILKENYKYYSQNQMAYYYNLYKDPKLKKSFENTFPKGNVEEIMKSIEEQLDPRLKEFADWQVDIMYPMLYRRYNEPYRRMYRTNMPWSGVYGGMIYREGFEIEEYNLLDQMKIMNTAVGAASTIERTGSNLPIKAMNIMNVTSTYLRDMEYFRAYAEYIRDIHKLFTNKQIKGAIKAVHGDYLNNIISGKDGLIDKLASNGVSTKRVDKLLNIFNTAFVLARIGLNPTVTIKQLTSIPTYGNDIGYANWLKYGLKSIPQIVKTWKEITKNSVYIEERYKQSVTRFIATYTEDGMVDFVPNQYWDFYVNFIMYSTKAGDKTAIYLGGIPNYLYYKDQAMKRGLSEEQAIKEAIIKFERDTKRTQQSSDIQDKDLFQTGSALSRSLNMFMTTPKQYLRKEIHATRNLYRKAKAWDKNAGQGSLWENARTLIQYHIFMPVIFQYITLGLPALLRPIDDEDKVDLLRAMVIGNLNALFVIGDIIAGLADLYQDKPYAGEMRNAGLMMGTEKVFELSKRYKETKDPLKKEAALNKLIAELVAVGGIPAPQIEKYITNLNNLGSDGDIGKDILRVINYSPYIIDKDKRKSSGSSRRRRSSQTSDEQYYKELQRREKEYQQMQDLINKPIK